MNETKLPPGSLSSAIESAQPPDTPWTRLDTFVCDWLRDSEVIGEDESGMEGTVRLTDHDQWMRDDAVQGLLSDDGFRDLLIAAEAFSRRRHRDEGVCVICGCPPPGHCGSRCVDADAMIDLVTGDLVDPMKRTYGAVTVRNLFERFVEITQQRDELLAALKRMPRALAERGMENAKVNNDGEAWNAFLYFLDPASFGGERLERVLAFLKRIEDERDAAIDKAEGRANELPKGGGLSCEGEPAAAATEETGSDRPAAPIDPRSLICHPNVQAPQCRAHTRMSPDDVCVLPKGHAGCHRDRDAVMWANDYPIAVAAKASGSEG